MKPEELAQIFENNSNCYADCDEVILAMDKQRFVKVVSEIIQKDDWISVKDRLPEVLPYRHENVLIAKSNGVVMEALYNSKVKKFLTLSFEHIKHDVDYWRLMLKHPKDL
jgi:hypothetical protein